MPETNDTTGDAPTASSLDAATIDRIFRSVLFADEEVPQDGSAPEGAVLVDGIRAKYGLHGERLEANRSEIAAALRGLPDAFHGAKGGGWSFLNACVDRQGRQWGEQVHVEQLLVLGIGLGMAQWLLPREVWRALPGGMPYVQVNVPEVNDAAA